MIVTALLSVAFAHPHEAPPAIEHCLAQWPDHPFGENPDFEVLSPSVRVLGVGPRQRSDERSQQPELVLVRPSVSLLTKSTLSLQNPNGWYCVDTPVGVMSKVVLDVSCGAHVADAHHGKALIAHKDTETGLMLLGSLRVERSCDVAELPRAKPEKLRADSLPAL